MISMISLYNLLQKYPKKIHEIHVVTCPVRRLGPVKTFHPVPASGVGDIRPEDLIDAV